jgi:hypothetical protein
MVSKLMLTMDSGGLQEPCPQKIFIPANGALHPPLIINNPLTTYLSIFGKLKGM